MRELSIELDEDDGLWRWRVIDLDYDVVASGTSPDYDEACRCARIAWEQHGKGEE